MPATLHDGELTAELLLLAGVGDWTATQWQEHDAKIVGDLAAEAKREAAANARIAARRKREHAQVCAACRGCS